VHLLLFDKAPAHDLVDSRFDKRRADRFALPVPLAIVRYRFLVVANVGLEFGDPRGQLLGRSAGTLNEIEIQEQRVQSFQSFFDVAMPQQVFDALQLFRDRRGGFWLLFLKCLPLLL
jgi:hypothetical protein